MSEPWTPPPKIEKTIPDPKEQAKERTRINQENSALRRINAKLRKELIAAKDELLERDALTNGGAPLDPLPDSLEAIRWTRKQRQYMRCLHEASKCGDKVATKGFIMDFVYGIESEQVDTNITGVFVCQLRKKLKGSAWWVETVWGEGYKLVRKA